MRHVHAEVIKAWADDTTLVVECRGGSGSEWAALKNVSAAMWYPDYQYRIKPEAQSRWMPIYKNGVMGSYYDKKEMLLRAHEYAGPHNPLVHILETRDDGTAHLHKVES